MQTYSSSARDGGLPYLQTAFTGVNYSDQITVLKDFLTPKIDSPSKRFIVGKVKNTLPAAGYLGFYVDELIKLKVEEVKFVTDGTLPVGNQTQLRIRFSHPLVTSSASTTYVEPGEDGVVIERVLENFRNVWVGHEFGKLPHDDAFGVVVKGFFVP